jgi:signal peptidase I
MKFDPGGMSAVFDKYPESEAYSDPSGSGIQLGDLFLINKIVYRFREPKRGEVVVFRYHGRQGGRIRLGIGPKEVKYLIGKVAGLPGEEIEFWHGRDHNLHINRVRSYTGVLPRDFLKGVKGEEIPLFAAQTPPRDSPLGPMFFIVDCLNQHHLLLRREIVGKVSVILYPPSRIRIIRP